MPAKTWSDFYIEARNAGTDDASAAHQADVAMGNEEMIAEMNLRVLQNLPGYPWLPCPVCHGTEGCDHTVPERARTAHPGLQMTF